MARSAAELTVAALDPAFAAFVAESSPRLLRSAYLLTGDRDAAEDLLQMALLRTGRRWGVAVDAPDAYAHRVLVNLLHDRRRALRRRPVERPLDALAAEREPSTDDAALAIDRITLLNAVRILPERQQEVLVLRFYADLSVSDTAAAIGTTPGTVKTHTSRALAALRRSLADPQPPSSIERDL